MAVAKRKLSYHQRILNILMDGQWHSFAEILKAVARFVDADSADKEFRKRHPNWQSESVALRVQQGRKRLVWLSLNCAIHGRHIVTARGSAMDRNYRLTADALKARQAKTEAKR